MDQEQIGSESEQSLEESSIITNGEQPELEESGVLAARAEDEKKDTHNPSNDGSRYGKFATADALLSAYNHLQSEFTKKCQKLSELEKSKSDNAPPSPIMEAKEEIAPLYESETWRRDVATFLDLHAEAKPYAAQISEEILNHPSKYQTPDALEQAWAAVASKHFVSKEQLSKDETFLNDYVFSNPNTKQRVLELFVSELEHAKPPTLMVSKGPQGFQPSRIAKNMEEAKNIVQNMFL